MDLNPFDTRAFIEQYSTIERSRSSNSSSDASPISLPLESSEHQNLNALQRLSLDRGHGACDGGMAPRKKISFLGRMLRGSGSAAGAFDSNRATGAAKTSHAFLAPGKKRKHDVRENDRALIDEFQKSFKGSSETARKYAKFLREFSAWLESKGLNEIAGRLDSEELTREFDSYLEVCGDRRRQGPILNALRVANNVIVVRQRRAFEPCPGDETLIQNFKKAAKSIRRAIPADTIKNYSTFLVEFSDWLRTNGKDGIHERIYTSQLDRDRESYVNAGHEDTVRRALTMLRDVLSTASKPSMQTEISDSPSQPDQQPFFMVGGLHQSSAEFVNHRPKSEAESSSFTFPPLEGALPLTEWPLSSWNAQAAPPDSWAPAGSPQQSFRRGSFSTDSG